MNQNETSKAIRINIQLAFTLFRKGPKCKQKHLCQDMNIKDKLIFLLYRVQILVAPTESKTSLIPSLSNLSYIYVLFIFLFLKEKYNDSLNWECRQNDNKNRKRH